MTAPILGDGLPADQVRFAGNHPAMFDAFGEPRRRFVRVTLDGNHCVMHPSEGDRYLQDARESGDSEAERYVIADVWLSEREFDDLPEHTGF
jgi:hypothetical protein